MAIIYNSAVQHCTCIRLGVVERERVGNVIVRERRSINMCDTNGKLILERSRINVLNSAVSAFIRYKSVECQKADNETNFSVPSDIQKLESF